MKLYMKFRHNMFSLSLSHFNPEERSFPFIPCLFSYGAPSRGRYRNLYGILCVYIFSDRCTVTTGPLKTYYSSAIGTFIKNNPGIYYAWLPIVVSSNKALCAVEKRKLIFCIQFKIKLKSKLKITLTYIFLEACASSSVAREASSG